MREGGDFGFISDLPFGLEILHQDIESVGAYTGDAEGNHSLLFTQSIGVPGAQLQAGVEDLFDEAAAEVL